MDRITIGRWTVDPADGTVSADGRVTRLEPKVMTVLLFLVGRQGSVVTHDELLRGVWHDAHVVPSALARSISILRQALGDDARAPVYIETVPKRGYRLAVPAVVAARPPVTASRLPHVARRAALAAALVALALIPSTSNRRPQGPESRPGPLISNYTRSGNENAFAYYTRAIALDPLSSNAHAGLASALAFRVDYLPDRRTWTTAALDMAMRAVAIDPNNPGAVKAVGLAHLKANHLERAAAAYRRALQLNPADAGVRNNLGLILLQTGHPAAALPFFEQRVVAEPDSPVGYANLAHGLVLSGFREEAVAAARRVLLLDPYARPAHLLLAVRDMIGGRYGDAEQRLERLLEVDRDCGRCATYLGIISQLTGRLDEAEHRYRHAEAFAGDNEVPVLRLAQLTAARGRREESDRLLATASARALEDLNEAIDIPGPPWRLAAAAAIRDDRAQAVAWYARAVAAGRRDFRWDRFDPLLSSLRDDPAFLELADPNRLAADHADAEPVVRRLASTLRVIDRRFGPFLTSSAATTVADPPGWPSRTSK